MKGKPHLFRIVILGCLATLTSAVFAAANTLQVNYDGFTVWLDCTRHGAYMFAYTVGFDSGHEPRLNDFALDPGVPAECQPTSSKTFHSPDGAPRFDRGHQVPANHMDGSPVSIMETNYMTNVLPQTSTLNRGAWLATEEIIECYRDLQDIQVFGGAIWGNDTTNDYFVESHGIETPDYYWKVIVRADGKALGWLFPNTDQPTRKRLDKYLVKILNLEKRTGERFPVTPMVRKRKPLASWPLPDDCDKG